MHITLFFKDGSDRTLKDVEVNEKQFEVLSTVAEFLLNYPYGELQIKKHNSIVEITVSNKDRVDFNKEDE